MGPDYQDIVKQNLLDFFNFRLQKVQNNHQVEAEILQNLMARMPEMEVTELIEFFKTVQQTISTDSNNLIKPLIPQPNQGQPMIINNQIGSLDKPNIREIQDVDDELFDELAKTKDKQVMRSLRDLNHIVSATETKEDESKNH